MAYSIVGREHNVLRWGGVLKPALFSSESRCYRFLGAGTVIQALGSYQILVTYAEKANDATTAEPANIHDLMV